MKNVCVLLLFSLVVSENIWELVAEQDAGPSVRYGHCAVSYHGSLVVSHGYFFDHERNFPTWLDDTWAFDPDTGSWEKILTESIAPSARYSHVCAEFDGDIYLFGGEDGGLSRHGDPNMYWWGAVYQDVWLLSMAKKAWQQLSTATSPPPRASPGFCTHGDRLVVFGGLTAPDAFDMHNKNNLELSDLDDLWVFSFRDHSWTQLGDGSETAPTKRHASVMAGFGDDYFVMGGFGLGSKNFNDVWAFNKLKNSWRQIASDRAPPPRGHHASAVLNTHMYVFGGGICVPSCRCKNDTWRFDMQTQRWEEVAFPGKLPIGVYRHTLTAVAGSLLLFGGESYDPYMYHSSLWRFNPSSPQGDHHHHHPSSSRSELSATTAASADDPKRAKRHHDLRWSVDDQQEGRTVLQLAAVLTLGGGLVVYCTRRGKPARRARGARSSV